MLYANFQGHWPLGSEKGDFLSFLPNMSLETILTKVSTTSVNVLQNRLYTYAYSKSRKVV